VIVLLYDGLCGFCDRTVQFILDHDRKGAISFAPLQGDFARGIFLRHPELREVDSLLLVESDAVTGQERVSLRSDGALRVAYHLGGLWRAAAIFRVVPRPVRDAAYDAFARIRYRVFGRLDACRLPTGIERDRYID
jgi:predicted DCC family thiol-disulfide oxidoreductase YuxK